MKLRSIALALSVSLAASGASAYKPAVEQEFSEIAANGCNNRDGDFVLRGLVSAVDEDTLVLADPSRPSSTISVTLPGRGPFSRAKGVFGKSKYEATDERLNALREKGTTVVVTMKCKGGGTPTARNISYENSDGTTSSISF
jgi:hypothetical protein